jgi:hypothetical protein
MHRLSVDDDSGWKDCNTPQWGLKGGPKDDLLLHLPTYVSWCGRSVKLTVVIGTHAGVDFGSAFLLFAEVLPICQVTLI